MTQVGGHSCWLQACWEGGPGEGQKGSGSSRLLPSARRCLHWTRRAWTPRPQLPEHCGSTKVRGSAGVLPALQAGWAGLYLSPVLRGPRGGAVKAVAGLDGPGPRVLAVLVPHGPSVVAVPGRLLNTFHGAGHQTHSTGSGAGSPFSGGPPAGNTSASERCSTLDLRPGGPVIQSDQESERVHAVLLRLFNGSPERILAPPHPSSFHQ